MSARNLLNQTLSIASVCWIVSVELIKTGYILTCDCQAVGQPFNAWFFPSFHHLPYSFYWTFHGITWLAGPYSVLWWALNSPAFFGYYVFFGYLVIVDLALFAWVWNRSKIYGLYFLTLNVWFTTLDPVDFFIVSFSVLGRFAWQWLLVAVLTKLPVGSEIFTGNERVWNWVFNDPNSLHGVENYGRYLILGTVFIVSGCLFWIGKRSRKSLALQSLEQSQPASSYPSRESSAS